MRAEVVSQEVFVSSPKSGVGVTGASYYTTTGRDRLISIHGYMSRSDTADIAFVRRSDDGGATWSAPEPWDTSFASDAGTGRRHPRGPVTEVGAYVGRQLIGLGQEHPAGPGRACPEAPPRVTPAS